MAIGDSSWRTSSSTRDTRDTDDGHSDECGDTRAGCSGAWRSAASASTAAEKRSRAAHSGCDRGETFLRLLDGHIQ